jgi:three-Cys-motif partner protein
MTTAPPGSPLIIAEQLETWQRTRGRRDFRFHLRPVEPTHRDSLRRALAGRDWIIDIDLTEEPTFAQALPPLRESIGDAPAFFFIDPQGWTGAEFELVALALAGRSKEALINFMYDRINEFAGVARRLKDGIPDTRSQTLIDGISRFFGTSGWVDVVLEDHPPQQREAALIQLYSRQLRREGLLAWSFRNKYPGKDRTYYYLVHVTRHLVGLKIMKELMIADDLVQPTLFEELDFERFAEELRLRFGGTVEVPHDRLLSYTLQETQYLDAHLRRALKEMEASARTARLPSGRRQILWSVPPL